VILNKDKQLVTKDVTYTTKASLYGVQVGAFVQSLPDNNFPNLKNVHSFIDNDGVVRYVIGSFIFKQQAENLKKAVIEAGYKDAFIVDVNKEKKFSKEVILGDNTRKNNDKKRYTVQIGAFITEVSKKQAKNYMKIEGIKELQDGELTILTVGNFKNFNQAEKQKQKLLEEGITGCFVIAVENGKKVKGELTRENSGL